MRNRDRSRHAERNPFRPILCLDNSPTVKFWSESDFGRDWRPPACIGWVEVGFSTLTTTVARFRYTSGAEGLLRRIGAISELAGMRYWSATHKQWQTLIVNAHALAGSQLTQRREDFTPDEMKDGKVLYLEQADNLSGAANYRMQHCRGFGRPAGLRRGECQRHAVFPS